MTKIILEEFKENGPEEKAILKRDLHKAYLLRAIDRIHPAYTALDASKPWMVFWIVHALNLLGEIRLPKDIEEKAILTLRACQHPDGGFGGGPGQLPHLACTYAAISALVSIGTKEAYDVINREGLLRFLLAMHQPDGSFTIHQDGEVDVRGSYCAMVAASLCGLLPNAELTHNVAEFVASCQTYEGGLGSSPGAEAHAGYAYCGVAALTILDKMELLDLKALDRWIVCSQCTETGGFNGRTHKLVDGCYSFWTGAIFPMLRRYAPSAYFDGLALQKYILLACQDMEMGGLRDKPGKGVDYYHTCYCLSGLSLAQRESVDIIANNSGIVLGEAANLLPAIVPEYNILPEQLAAAQAYFSSK